jgi:hypothetical protein
MKKIVFILVAFLMVANATAQWTDLGSGVQPRVKSSIEELRIRSSLPWIAGKWFFVDAKNGSATAGGKDLDHPVLTLKQAYDKCTTGAGDGIAVISRSISGTAYGTAETDEILWTKYGITVVGIAAPNVYAGRARITHITTGNADSLVYLMYLTGQNNTFININFSNTPDNDGTPVSATAQVSAVKIGGARNAFVGCMFYCYPQTANAYKCDVELTTSSDETRFIDCYFGQSAYDAGNNAASWIYLSGAAAQHFYKGCTFLQQVSSGTAFGGYETSGATVLNGVDIFEDCIFSVWRANTHADICASWFIGTLPNTGAIIMKDCLLQGFTEGDATAGNDLIWTNQPAAAATGGESAAIK